MNENQNEIDAAAERWILAEVGTSLPTWLSRDLLNAFRAGHAKALTDLHATVKPEQIQAGELYFVPIDGGRWSAAMAPFAWLKPEEAVEICGPIPPPPERWAEPAAESRGLF